MSNEKIEGYRLSPQQRRLWLLQKNSSAFRAQGAVSLAGPFSRDLLDASLKQVVERHEILRTAFRFVPGMDVPLQVIRESAAFVLTEVDLGGHTEEEQLARLDAQWQIERERAFDYELGTPLHVCLLTLSAQRQTLLLTLPAMCADARAVRNVAHEIARFYVAAQAAEDGEVVQYADVSEWQNELLESDEAQTHQEFWRQQTGRGSATIKLPLEKHATGDRPYRPLMIARALDADLTQRSRAFADAHEMPHATVLLSCWQSLLRRLTGEAEVVVDTGFAARKYDGLDEAVGVFQKFLPVRCDFERALTFPEACKRVDQAVREADEWQEYFAGELTPPGDSGGGSAVQTSAGIGFDYIDLSVEPGAARWKLTRLYSCIEPFKLRLSCRIEGEACGLELHYDPLVYGEDDAQRLAGEFMTLLGSVLNEPEAPLASAALLSADELQQILLTWNDTIVGDTQDGYTPRLFEEQVERTPERVAVTYGDDQLSFAELNRRANQLAHHLRLLGVGAETTVGLLLRRSVELLVGVLGIWKAGGAYVPLDPDYPQERLSYILQDAGVRVLLTTHMPAARACAEGREVIYLDSEWTSIARQSAENPAPAATADNLAYVIYTSGSTGTPKGVMIQHRSVCNLGQALRRAIYVNHAEWMRVSVNAPLSFDASVKQLIQLLSGHTLDMLPEDLRRDGSALLAYIERRGIEVLDCTPSQLHLLLEAGLGKRAGQMPRALLLGGEEVTEALWRTLSEIDDTIFYNVYGPTECTVDATACRVGAENLSPSIGRPLANMQTYVLDGQLRPVPVGVAGELCIGGAGLARGYLSRPDSTCERFVPHPFSRVAGARLYRTGDLARHLPDGRIEYLGRIDQQIKLRGFRIELGEIEATLSQHPGVREAVVMVREDAPGEKRLVGYVVGQQPAKAVEGHTRYRLPNGMLIVHLNRTETDYLYEEIFEEQVYFKHGVRLRAGACVLDVGANIGMFTLFISQHYPDARVYAFEPISPVYEALRINAELYGPNVKTFNYGLSDEAKQAAFAYYPQFSARSGLLSYADAENEVEVIKAFLRNKERSGVAGMEELADAADELLAGVFESVSLECELKRLSDVIREEKLERIDLLKIDVQRAELDVLDGIAEADWAKVEQVVMEVHDAVGDVSEGRVAAILDLLERHGFEAVAVQDDSLQGTDRHSLYAIRPEGVNALGGAALTALPTVAPGAAAEGKSLYRLPNNLEVFHQNRNETEFIYKQIFEDQQYLRHGIVLEPGSCVFDVGANIGLFTLYVHHKCRDARVYSFEPIPSTFEKLRSNVALYGLDTNLFNSGLSDHTGTATFTFYPKWSASSGAYANLQEEEEALKMFLQNQGELVAQYADQLISGRYEGEQVVCSLRTLSEIIAEQGIERIDLLKLDVEKSELDILNGIEEGDWEKIRQIVMEVHDIEGRVGSITATLDRLGFNTLLEQDAGLTGTGIYNLYASRSAIGERAAQQISGAALETLPAARSLPLGVDELRKFLKERLPEHMVPTAFVILDEFPLTTNAKVDRRALPTPEEMQSARAVAAPHTLLEEMLVGIWRGVLRVEQIGVDENFFEVGGHSLLATQLMSRVREAFQVEIPLRTLFEGPTVAELARAVEAALKSEQHLNAPPITPVSRQQKLPLSFAQQRLWFLDQMEPENPSYNVPAALRLAGRLNISALEQTLTEIVRRHEVLRTHFAVIDGQPVQVIAPASDIKLPIVDLGDLDKNEREAKARQLASVEAQRPFQLHTGPLVRAELLRLDDEEHIALFTMHHIVSDGWSMSVLIREVAALYEAFSHGQPSSLPELAIQYADFAVWQREWLQGEVLEGQLRYWREQLRGAPPLLEFPTDRPRPALASYNGATHFFMVPAELANALRALSQREGATLYMTLLAAFQILLSRYSGQEDIVVGTPIAGRNRAEIEPLIGFFINTLVLRTDLSGEPNIIELLRRVREVCLGAYAHQDLPFEMLVEQLQPQRSLSYSPLFQMLFVLQNVPVEELKLSGLALSPVANRNEVAKFDLVLDMQESGESITGALEYNSDIFDAASVARLAAHLLLLLRSIADHPLRPVSRLPLLPPHERHLLLARWNNTPAAFPHDLCLHHLFARQAALTPHAPAILARGLRLSYARLDERANRLARHLLARGAAPDTPVALCLERGPDQLVALLGVLKAGAPYLPLDPRYPARRLAATCADAGARLLVTTRPLLSAPLRAVAEAVVLLDEEAAGIAARAATDPGARVAAGNLAYVIYTSGSTGVPKGVGVAHRAVVSHNHAVRDLYGLGAADRVLQFASPSFDVAVEEIFPTWLSGGAVVVREEEALGSARGFFGHLAAEGVTVVNVPTAFWQQMVAGAEAEPEVLAGVRLRVAAVGGEMGQAAGFAQARRVLGGRVRLLNVYGPTETTVTNTAFEYGAGDGGGAHQPAEEPRGGVPIGRPIANTEVYVLDASMQPIPVGVWGELYIGGDGLARGYLRRPALTAERFVPHPFGGAGGARLYRTGDVVRYTGAGELEFVGRRDGQVKVRGYRVELGEVEAALGGHAAVRECAVAVREEAGGDRRLVAYVVVEAGREPAAGEVERVAGEWRRYLKERLPEHMVPSAYVEVGALPLTPNGKVDRRALPAPEAAGARGGREYLAPGTVTEELVCGMWAEVLGVGRVGVGDDFFELGGHSLLATQVISRVRQAFGVEVALREMFEGPTVAELSHSIESILRDNSGGVTVPPLTLANRDEPLPLSFAQQRLWFLDQLEPDAAAYNIPAALRLRGPLDAAALQRSLSEIVRRHEALRTTFAVLHDEPRQLIHPPRPVELPLFDLSALGAAEREREARRLVGAEAVRPFDLAGGPLLRAGLVRLGEEEHVALLTMHHIVSDGWSIGVLVKEVAALYEAYSTGHESPLAELEIQYADYAVWQRGWLQGAVLEEQLSYWREQLAGAPAVLDLPTDRVRPPKQSYRGAVHTFALSEELSRELHALSRREGCTLFMTLLAAFQVLLSRYSGQEDISIGTSIAGRTRAETEGLIGFFVNTLVLRTDLSGGGVSFREALRRVREVTLGAYAHQDVPFEKLVEELQPTRELSHSPLFQVMMVMPNAPEEALALSGLALSAEAGQSGVAKYDLSLAVGESKAGIEGAIGYSTDLFDAGTIARMSEHFEHLLEGIISQPDQQITRLALMRAGERDQVVREWNETGAEYPSDKCVHELFEEQVERTPEAVAVTSSDEHLTYRELNERANQLAHYLRERGVGPDTLVGICVERSTQMIIGLLGILKAGAAYLPLDPTYPLERLHFMLEDTRAQMVVTVEALADALPSLAALPLCLDTDWPLIAGHDVDNPRDVDPASDNLAYVTYTSGSTGLPKGVAVPHRGVVRLVRDNHYAHLDPNEVLLQFAPLSFDASTFEVWGSLLNGARLVIMPPGKQSLAELGQVIRRQGVTTLWLTAGLFRQMVDEQLDDLSGLRQLLAGGDVLSAVHVRKFLEAEGNNCVLINGYGPTESTTFACCHPVAMKDTDGSSVPLGRPIANTQIYILDAELQPTPIGMAGELHIGGEGLARGYLNRPGLTAERFIPHPFAETPGARLYRTGDLARYLPDGNIEFLRRLNHQVKVRGFRIELGEIEAALRTHPLVAEAVVAARRDGHAAERLVAYVVAHEGQPPTGLRQYLGERLPDYMVPQAFVELSEVPLTPSGKVDRKALPAPGPAGGAESAYVAPRGASEELVAGIWAEVLGVGRVGVEDNFFELGGHSLLATQVISRIRAVLNIEIPLRIMFEQPTVRALALEGDARLRAGESVSAPPLVQVGRDKPLPLSFAQQRLWFLDQLEPDAAAYNIPAALRLRGPLDAAALQRSLSEIVRRHEALRTTFAVLHDEPRQLIHPPRPVELPLFDLSALGAAEREREARRLVGAEAVRPFDLAGGPLLRAGLVRLGEEEHVALLTMHHIVSDGWSIGVLVKEVAALYEAYSTGHESPLAELEIQYADYAVWQRGWLQGAVLEEQLSYWREQLAGAPAVLDLPTDRVRPRIRSYQGAAHGFALGKELSRALKELSQRESVTLFMTLLAAFQVLLSRYSGQEDISIGTSIAGRTRAETEGLIGFFVNTLVLRTDLSGGGVSFREALRRVREVTLGAYAHQDVPFEKLVEELQPTRELSHSPLFQVMMVMPNAPEEALALSGLALSAEAGQSGVAKYDLSLAVGESKAGIEGAIGYSTDLFDAGTIARMSEHFEHLLEGIISDPEQEIRSAALMRAGERHQVVREWNETGREYAEPHLVHRLFEEQVKRTPLATAVIFEGEQVTYGELNERANRLAHHLRYLGVGPEVTVGVFMERSVEMVVALMGVLKAGAAYLPLDPAYPQERLRFMLADAAAPVLLTQHRLADLLPVPELHVVRLDAEPQAPAVESRANPQTPVLPEHPAYVIYTSGSTGQPKGVVIPHQGICNRLLWMQEAYALDASDRVLQKTPFSFDVSVWEFFWPLSTGACLVVAQPGGHQDTRYLAQLIEAQEVTTLHFVPSMLDAFLEEEGLGERCRKVRRVICSGEALGVETARRFMSRIGNADLYNLYGPTEASVDVTWWRCEQLDELRNVPIGRPIANTQIYVLDESMQAVAVGVTGELYIGGGGLARGYLNRPGLTAERFIPHPFAETPGARLYRTGDLARYRAGGDIEFLGRLDHQVKVRGFRIELGEIEAALRTHPLVAEAVVAARRDGHAAERLVAYVVAHEGQPPTGLRQYLGERLPDYMVPQAFVELAEVPLTPSGKVDRKALPAPGPAGGAESAYVAPRGASEELVAGYWAEVLGVGRVGVEDNFFELGGHSLLATQVISRVRAAFGVEVPLRAMFEQPTVEKLARAIEVSRRSATAPPASTIVRASRDAHRLKQSLPETQSSDEGLIGTLR